MTNGGRSVRFDSIVTPVGTVFVGVSDRGVCDVAIGETSERRYRARVGRWASEARRDREAAAAALGEIGEYFAGGRTRFSAAIDLTGVTAFTARVLREAMRIPFGGVASYGELARRIGDPRASRAVGGALGRNPVAIIVPCHRVVTGERRLGGFSAGLAVKRALLRHEGHRLSAGLETARLRRPVAAMDRRFDVAAGSTAAAAAPAPDSPPA